MAPHSQIPMPVKATTRTPLPTLESRRAPYHLCRPEILQPRPRQFSPLANPLTQEPQPRPSPEVKVQLSPKLEPQPSPELSPQVPPNPQPQPQPQSVSTRPAGRDHRAKTERERKKGKDLENPESGVEATKPCACCSKRIAAWAAAKPTDPATKPKCWVPRDPVKDKTYKCAHCISSKVKCSFTVDNPGTTYQPATLEKTLPQETKKRLGRQKAAMTMRRKKKAAMRAISGGPGVAPTTPPEGAVEPQVQGFRSFYSGIW
ncbi:hypothetical protein F5Y14DRAFT_459760 [Nemania sp. NC0429]|nr:hypothetical protein F5Y14DRAFT_459760 [Nemania sp. NC0429]